MRILHVIKSLGRGGAEMLLLEGLRAARPGTEQAFVYFVPWKDALVAPLEAEGASVRCLAAKNALGMLKQVGALGRIARDWRAEVIHAHLPLAGVVARMAGRLIDVPVVYTEHNLMERYHAATRTANLATWTLQSRVIAVSDDVKGSAERHAGTNVPVEVVLNGVSLSHFQRTAESGQAVRRELGIPLTAPVIGCVAVFRTQKRLDVWLEAAARFLRTHTDAHFLLVGDGPMRADVVVDIARHGLQERVHLTGLQEEVRPYLSAMDAYMMSSDFEGLPVAMLEAMAMELPVVATGVGGIPEVLTTVERGGVVVPPRRADELADALVRVFRGKDERDGLGAAARMTVAAGFSVERMQGELESAYVRTCEEWHGRR